MKKRNKNVTNYSIVIEKTNGDISDCYIYMIKVIKTKELKEKTTPIVVIDEFILDFKNKKIIQECIGEDTIEMFELYCFDDYFNLLKRYNDFYKNRIDMSIDIYIIKKYIDLSEVKYTIYSSTNDVIIDYFILNTISEKVVSGVLASTNKLLNIIPLHLQDKYLSEHDRYGWYVDFIEKVETGGENEK